MIISTRAAAWFAGTAGIILALILLVGPGKLRVNLQPQPEAGFWDAAGAQAECQASANKQAKYAEAKWQWLIFKTHDSGKDGVMMLTEKNAQFQNGFGAWKHVSILCGYNLKTGRALAVITE
jgi:hypothetical protein